MAIVVDDDMKTQLFQLHTKLIGNQPLVRELIYSCYLFNLIFRLYISFTIGSLMIFFSFGLLEYYLYSIWQPFLSGSYVSNVMR
jgi:hypothetical protein